MLIGEDRMIIDIGDRPTVRRPPSLANGEDATNSGHG
jgi:hypothetical protein